MATKHLIPNLSEFRRIKGRVSELYENSGDTIRAKKTVYMHSGMLADMRFLVVEAERLIKSLGTALDPDVSKVAAYVSRVCAEQEKAIKGGQFIKVNAGLFKTARFLVRELEKIIVSVVDEEEGLALRVEKLADEGGNRIELDVTDILGVGPEDEDDEPKKPDIGTTDELTAEWARLAEAKRMFEIEQAKATVRREPQRKPWVKPVVVNEPNVGAGIGNDELPGDILPAASGSPDGKIPF